MQSPIYVALSGQVALERRMETLARNVANLSTVGYRADEVKFETILSQAGRDTVAFASTGPNYISRQAGALTHTGNPLDLAIEGDGWFAIETGAGPAYTRDGRFTIDEAGQLRTVVGYLVLDAGLAPIQIEAEAGPPVIARDGMIMQNGQQVGAVGLFRIDPAANMRRFENSAVIPDIPGEAVLDFVGAGMVQGYTEGSNVNPVLEMTKLIMVQRAFESAAAAVDQNDRSRQDAIRTLGDVR